MATDIATDTVKFHLSLNSSDLARSIAFYSVLFGREPAKMKSDYAKFEVDEPPLIMSLIPAPTGSGGNLNHIGLRLTDSAALVTVQARLEQAGYATQREEGVECCYSKQTKFWVTDPDRTLWELYILHEDGDDHASAHSQGTVVAIETLMATPPRPKVTWQHLLTQPLPQRIPQEDATVDEALLQGTLNMQNDPDQLAVFLREVFRVLKPGGSVTAHHLSSDRPLDERPQLPGPAALVQQVLIESAGVKALTDAGFANIEFTKLGQKPCFTVGCVQLRETKLTGYRPAEATTETIDVLYKGPLSQVSDDQGNVYRRGQRVSVRASTAQMLRQGAAADQFVFFVEGAPSGGCCS